MWLILGLVLLVIWAASFFAFHVTGFLIHILIVFAVISFVLHLFTGNKSS